MCKISLSYILDKEMYIKSIVMYKRITMLLSLAYKMMISS